MESVISISRIAASSPGQLNNYIETSQAEMSSLRNRLDMGHFAKLIQKFKENKSNRPLSAPEPNNNAYGHNKGRHNSNTTDIERSISDESESSSISIQQHNIMKKSKFVVESYFQPAAAAALKQQKCKVCKCVVNNESPGAIGDKPPSPEVHHSRLSWGLLGRRTKIPYGNSYVRSMKQFKYVQHTSSLPCARRQKSSVSCGYRLHVAGHLDETLSCHVQPVLRRAS